MCLSLGKQKYLKVFFFSILIYLPNATSAIEYDNHALGIRTHVPPASVCVIDMQGRMSGMNPDSLIDAWGGSEEINQIPKTEVDSQNIASDEESEYGKPQDKTAWFITIADGGKQTYSIVVKGIVSGVQRFTFSAFYAGERTLRPDYFINVLVGQDKYCRFQVTYDPANYSKIVTIDRGTTATKLMDALDVSCKIGDIDSNGICQSLKAKLVAISGSIGVNNVNAAKGELTAFLNELKAQGGKHVKEPSLSILLDEGDSLKRSINYNHLVLPNLKPGRKEKSWWWPF